MADVDDFERFRPLLFSIAYRMLGSAAEAEDVVQDTWLRYSTARAPDVRSPKAYLTTIATRLALDRLKSARMAREEYVGPWLPEPVLTEGRPEPERSLVLAESLTLASSFLNSSEANCRQLFHRAKERLATGGSRSGRSREEKRKLAQRFVSAMRAGDRSELTQVLADDVGFWSDGGGRVVAAKRPVLGKQAVVNLLLGIRRTALLSAGSAHQRLSVEVVEVNYEPAMLVRVDGRLDSVYVCSIADDAIAGIRVVRNPDKLVYIRRQLAALEHGSPSGGPGDALLARSTTRTR